MATERGKNIMAMYGIMRVEKRRRSAVYGIQIEASRTPADHARGRDFDNSDIDWEKTQNNIFLVRSESWNKEITKQIHAAGVKEKKDSVVMLDGLYTASAEWFEGKTEAEIRKYFEECKEFYIKEYCGGDESRVISAVIHLDEATPHLHIQSVPLLEDEKGLHLSAKRIMGFKSDYRKRQDRFYEQVSKARGLERGEIHDPAHRKAHTTKREWQIATQEEKLNQLKKQIVYNRAMAEIDPSDLVRYLYKRDPDLLIEAVRQTRPEIFERICKEEDYQEEHDHER